MTEKPNEKLEVVENSIFSEKLIALKESGVYKREKQRKQRNNHPKL